MRRDFIHKPVLRGADLLATQTTEMERIFGEHAGARCDRWQHYLPVYDRHLSSFRQSPVRFLEIGVANGGSFEVWRRYFGQAARLHGLDISRSEGTAQVLAGVQTALHIGDQKDRSLLMAIVAQMGGLDVVIDDGSHVSSDQIATFEILYPLLSPGGVYICEDTHTSYFSDARAGSFVMYAKKKVDELHSWYLDDSEKVSDEFSMMTRSVLFYDSMVVFERASTGKTEPRRIVVGQDP